jgi:hypothetical protein
LTRFLKGCELEGGEIDEIGWSENEGQSQPYTMTRRQELNRTLTDIRRALKKKRKAKGINDYQRTNPRKKKSASGFEKIAEVGGHKPRKVGEVDQPAVIPKD